MLSRRTMFQGLGATALASAAGVSRAAKSYNPVPTVRHLAQVTRDEYHDPDAAGAIARHLLDGVRRGAFRVSTAEELAARLNAEVAAASKDAHFVVMAGSMVHLPPVPPTEPHQQPPPLNASEIAYLKRRNFGIAAAEILPGNVGRLEVFEQFFRPARELRDRLGVAMTFLSDTGGLIVDLSRTFGGDPKSVALYLSYFFDREPFVVNRFRWRNRPTEEFWTTRTPGGPLYGETRPVAVLVSRATVSAPEEFAYNMKATKRGIIVGQRTAGAANHALPVQIAGGFTAFIPKARAENPVTGANWEGVGVEPDVLAPDAGVETARKLLIARPSSGG